MVVCQKFRLTWKKLLQCIKYYQRKIEDLVHDGKSYKDAEKEAIEKLLATNYEDFKFYKSNKICTIL